MSRTPVLRGPHPNGDERIVFGAPRHIGNFHKTLPHDEFGEVRFADYARFIDIAATGNFEKVDQGPLSAPHQTTFKGAPPARVARLVNPQCGRSTDVSGPDPLHLEMQPAPGVRSDSTAAEFTELQWMALLRDVAFDTWSTNADVAAAATDLKAAFAKGLADGNDTGRLQLGVDLAEGPGNTLRLDAGTLFRVGLKDEDKGPIVSQFLLHDFNYGAHLIDQTLIPYAAQRDHLVTHEDWLLAQNTGYDCHGNDYGADNSYAKDQGYYDPPAQPGGQPARVRIRNMRDLARFVNRDALHQAYFNAALQLLNWNAPANGGNPYTTSYLRQGGFGTLGGPNLLALVSEVSSRALKVVWRQKWLVHRRLRPEAYGGLLQMQDLGLSGIRRQYGMPAWAFDTEAAKRVLAKHGTRFLPMAYSAGSPVHPSYGAGHAAVAGACVTILKAWFADVPLAPLVAGAAAVGKDPAPPLAIVQPGTNGPGATLPAYTGGDIAQMTVHGELNKLAANVALGRSMGGVHWRSDNTRSLRLGERVATIMLRRILPTYAERPLQLDYVNFDGDQVTIEASGEVTVANDPDLTEFYSQA